MDNIKGLIEIGWGTDSPIIINQINDILIAHENDNIGDFVDPIIKIITYIVRALLNKKFDSSKEEVKENILKFIPLFENNNVFKLFFLQTYELEKAKMKNQILQEYLDQHGNL